MEVLLDCVLRWMTVGEQKQEEIVCCVVLC